MRKRNMGMKLPRRIKDLLDVQDNKETNLLKIVAVVIASLPHSPSKVLITSSPEKASLGLIVTNTIS